jgi:hypothetical protein
MPKPAAEIFFEDYNAAPCETLYSSAKWFFKKKLSALHKTASTSSLKTAILQKTIRFLYFSSFFGPETQHTKIYAVSQDQRCTFRISWQRTLSDMISKEGTSNTYACS